MILIKKHEPNFSIILNDYYTKIEYVDNNIMDVFYYQYDYRYSKWKWYYKNNILVDEFELKHCCLPENW